jgi:hypothetical protein
MNALSPILVAWSAAVSSGRHPDQTGSDNLQNASHAQQERISRAGWRSISTIPDHRRAEAQTFTSALGQLPKLQNTLKQALY